MARVDLNPNADRSVALIAGIGLHTYMTTALLPSAQARVDEETGLLKASIEVDPDIAIAGPVVEMTIHDGPGARGKTYGAAEEVMRGGSHAFLRPALDATWAALPQAIRDAFGDPAMGGSITAPGGSLPAPSGTWTPSPRGKTYRF